MKGDPVKYLDALFRHSMRAVKRGPARAVRKYLLTPVNLRRNRQLSDRKLEIGPGNKRLPGFETLNILDSANVDYVLDASKRLPFPDGAFTLIYASHVLEHIPWYRTEDVLKEWTRILADGGRLEIWIPDGLKICNAFVAAELAGENTYLEDGWFRFNDQRDPCRWASGRIFSYGDGRGTLGDANWHLALFSRRYLKSALERCGLRDVHELRRSDVRGHDHGWINLGMSGTK